MVIIVVIIIVEHHHFYLQLVFLHPLPAAVVAVKTFVFFFRFNFMFQPMFVVYESKRFKGWVEPKGFCVNCLHIGKFLNFHLLSSKVELKLVFA